MKIDKLITYIINLLSLILRFTRRLRRHIIIASINDRYLPYEFA